MFRFSAQSLAAPAPGLLSTVRRLGRLHPVEIGTDDLAYRAYLVARVYTGVSGPLPWKHGWAAVLGEALRYIDKQGWFEIDWATVEADKEADMQVEEEEQGFLNRWLWQIPILRYGFSDWDDDWPNQQRGMAVLKALVKPGWIYGQDFLGEYAAVYDLRLPDALTTPALQRRLAEDDFSGYSEPLCWLPFLAKVAANATGDPLLDYQNYSEDEPPWYAWTELDQARRDYQAAKPHIDRLKHFLEWGNGPDQVQPMLDALAGGSSGRKRQRKRRAGNERLKLLEKMLR